MTTRYEYRQIVSGRINDRQIKIIRKKTVAGPVYTIELKF
jgi:hypothetical protein